MNHFTERSMAASQRTRLVQDCMSTSLLTVTSDDSLQTAAELLHRRNIRELPVVDHGRLVGILTDRDVREMTPGYPLFRAGEESRSYLQTLLVAKAMTVDPFVITPETPLVKAAELLTTYRIGSLPVVKDGKLVGIISVTDLLRVFIEQNKPGRPSAKTKPAAADKRAKDA
ncbi:MAG TPA: CBS domain-containing protein [Candidatus Binatia bacterium]|jgi:acetoin utilization protein AcuB